MRTAFGRRHGFVEAIRYVSARLVLILVLIGAIAALTLIPTTPAEASSSYTLYFAYEYTSQTGQFICFYNLTDVAHTVTVTIYNPGGSHFGDRTVDLRGRETVTITDPKTTWGLPVAGGDGTPATDEAYGIVATSDTSFAVIVASDETSELPGTGASSINPQGELYDDSWWGMYNYDDPAKNDYVYIFNAQDTGTTVSFTVYDTDGTQIGGVTSVPFGPRQTQKIYPYHDLSVGLG